MDVEKTPAPTCTCPSGDGSLRSPCPAHGALPAINLQHEALGFVLFPLSPAAVAPHVAQYIIGFDFDEVRDVYGDRFAVFWQGLVAMFLGHPSAQTAFAAHQLGAQERVAWASTGATGHKVVAMPGLHQLPYGDYDLYATRYGQGIDLGKFLPHTTPVIDKLQDVMATHGFAVPVRVISDALRTAMEWQHDAASGVANG